jgi:hypothetical protein
VRVILSVKVDRYGAIVDEGDLHVRAENARFNFFNRRSPQRRDKLIEELRIFTILSTIG